eukprot:GHVU01191849.1.p1 GENE.GHVU01191849.1~~GHVU01191849.1.p1  ORF type:complete len:103 (+),score=0.79 GHVU01191849.1:504-812(+)
MAEAAERLIPPFIPPALARCRPPFHSTAAPRCRQARRMCSVCAHVRVPFHNVSPKRGHRPPPRQKDTLPPHLDTRTLPPSRSPCSQPVMQTETGGHAATRRA